MGVFYKGLYLPAFIEEGWDDEVNANFTLLADAHVTARSVFLDAADGYDHSSTRAGITGTFPNSLPTFALTDSGGNTGVQWVFRMPEDSSGTTLLVRPVWAPLATVSGAITVRWQMDIKDLVGASMVAAGATVAWTGVSGTKTSNVPVLETGQASTGFSPAAASLVRFALTRVSGHAEDNLTTNALVIGVRLDYTAF